jgi:hypothetical protein
LEENQPHPRGGLEDPLAPEEIRDKFRANARLALPNDIAEKLIDAVNRLEQLPAIGSLSELLARR